MVWLLVIALFIVFLVPSRYRLHTLGGIILLALLGFLLSQPEDQEEVRDLIPLEQVEFVNAELQRSRGVGQEFVGKIKNNSKAYKLTGLGVHLTIKDCIKSDDTSQEHCTILDEAQIHLPLFIPPQEQGEFRKRLYLRELHIRGRKQWDYTPLYTETKEKGFWQKLPFLQD